MTAREFGHPIINVTNTTQRQKEHRQFINEERFTNATGSPVADNTNSLTAGPRGPLLLQDIWLLEKLAHFDREVIPEGRMHAKG